MYWTFLLLIGLSTTAAFQVNWSWHGIGKRFLSTVLFGDSTSDTGNVYQLTNHTWPISPPFYHGRYSNGPNWADDLGVLLKFNYAYGSATTDNNLVQGLAANNAYPVPGLLQQVQQYLSDSKTTILVPSAGETVHIVWGGANDVVADPLLLANLSAIVGSLMNSVEALAAGGAKTIIVFNQEPLQNVPVIAAYNQTAEFELITAAVNNGINASLHALKVAFPAVNFYLFDLHSLIAGLQANLPPPVTILNGHCVTVVGPAIQSACPNPQNYFFFDTFHFTSTIQKKLAEAVGKFYQHNFVPSSQNYFYAV